MANKKNHPNSLQATLSIALDQAKETFDKARSFVKVPTFMEHKKLTNDRILSGLRNLGVASKDDVEDLDHKVRKLERQVAEILVEKLERPRPRPRI